MDSNTFTCTECGRTLSTTKRGDPDGNDSVCINCAGGREPGGNLDGEEPPSRRDGQTTVPDTTSGASNGAEGDGGDPEPDERLADRRANADSRQQEESHDSTEKDDGNAGAIESGPGTSSSDIEGSGGEDRFWDHEPRQELRTVETSSGEEVTEPGSSGEAEPLDRRIDSWKEQLLDLTRRNTLVDFSETKTKTLPVTGASPPAVASYLRDGAIHIHKQPPVESTPSLDSGEVLSSRSAEETSESLYRIELNEKQYLRERGVDTLYLALGMLEWVAPDEPENPYRSPLFLAAVDLTQEPVSDSDLHNYVLEAEGDDLLINPALRKRLSSEFRLELPPDDALGLECIDAAFQRVSEGIGGFDNWRIDDAVVLGVFDFAKYSLYTDLEQNREKIREDPIIRALDDDMTALQESEGHIETPDPGSLDQSIDLKDVYQVLDADSSQQAAIEAAKRGRSIVIQGPPGTGKSQTISNIIAEKLAAGETVLFVSEKQAALNVVKDRLDTVGVGRFCLEAHGRKATKSNVLESLATEIKSNPVKKAPDREAQIEALLDHRSTLNEFGDVLLTAPDGFAITPHEAFGTVAANQDVPDIEIGVESPLGEDQEAYDAAVESLRDLTYFDSELANYENHPWRPTTIEAWKVDTRTKVQEAVKEHEESVETVAAWASQTEQALGIQLECCDRLDDGMELVNHLEARPEIDWQRGHFAEQFVRLGSRLAEYAKKKQRIDTLREDLAAHYRASIFETSGTDLHGTLSRYGVFRWLRPSYYSTRDEVLSHAEEGYDPSFDDLVEDTRKLTELQHLEQEIAEYDDVEQALEPLDITPPIEWGSLLTAREWVARLTELPFDATDIVDSLIEDTLPAIEPLREDGVSAQDEFEQSHSQFADIMDVDDVRVEGVHLYQARFEAARSHLQELRNRVDELESWVEFVDHLDAAKSTLAEDYLDRFLAGDFDTKHLVPAFEKRFLTGWLNGLYEESALGSFNAETFRKHLTEFRRLDQEQQELAKIAVQHRVTAERPTIDLEHADSSQQVILRREIQKQRQHKPLRELFDEAGDFITTLKPCFMMSPLSVAQYLKEDSITFDTVIFDEASQVMPEDAVSSLIRGEQVIIAGDTKQLPPTRFFDTETEAAEGVREDLDSILEEAAAILPEVNLTWHYRSRTAELIEFSNQLYYNGRLQTFPENDPGTDTGVEFEYVSEGVYDRGGTRRNEVEAERVADIVAEHARSTPQKSLGVVAFSVAQEDAIRDAIQERRADDSELDRFIEGDDILGEFFVKNLEMVQGDERDRMVFSVGYGPDENGNVTMNFGPLNQDGGERRLNVAVTRAREQVTVVSSILPEEIDLSQTSSTGVAHFKQYLEYARHGREVLSAAGRGTQPEFETAFQESVYETLTDRGYDVDVISSSGYSLDLGVRADAEADSYELGIEFDASAYHWSNTARDRDRIRPSVLEDLGWEVFRIWTPDWVTNQERVLSRLDDLMDGGAADIASEEGIEVSTYEPEEYTREELDAMLDTIESYREPAPKSDQKTDIESADAALLEKRLQSIVLEYGPVHQKTAFRVLADEFGEPRRTQTLEDRLSETLQSLSGDQQIVEADGFLWPQRHEVTLTVRQNDTARRGIDEIPLEEIALAVAIILDAGISMTREDLIVETTRLLGYDRVGSRIRERLNQTIDRLVEAGYLNETERVTLTTDPDEVRAGLLDLVYQ